MRATTGTQTLKLATARLEFNSDRRIRNVLHFVAVVALVVLVALIGRQLHADTEAATGAREALARQNAALGAELERAKMELQLERSTRAALARQVADLDAETSELRSRLDFFNAQTGRAGKSPQ
jgi:cell division protein FtsB